MTAQHNNPSPTAGIPDAEITETGNRLPIVWLLPLIAALVGAWLLYKTISEQGPTVTISFQTAEGIQEGKTKVKYRDVVIGQVESVRYSTDLSHVIVTAELTPSTEAHLTDASRFWVVRPRVRAGGISGLDTLLSGAYIALDPGKGGKSAREFTGLEEPPGITSDTKGSIYHLRAKTLGSLSVGSPVYYRQLDVGEVVKYELSEDHQSLDISIFVKSPHDQFVHRTTRFWNVAGLEIKMDADGLTLDMESLTALLSGGVAFETPTSLRAPERATEGSSFTLYESYAKSQEQPITEAIPYVLYFEDTVRGLAIGAPVEFRGIRVGSVVDIRMELRRDTEKLLIPVYIQFEPDRLHPIAGDDLRGMTDEEKATARKKFMEGLVAKGLRARLQTGNLLTGQLFVEFDIFPDDEHRIVSYDGPYPELPTLPRPLLGIMASLSNVLAKLERLPLKEIGKEVEGAASGLNRLANDPDLIETIRNLQQATADLKTITGKIGSRTDGIITGVTDTLASADSALQQAKTTLESFEGIADKDSPMGHELLNTLEQLSAAARSIRFMAEYLERHPEALLKGKK